MDMAQGDTYSAKEVAAILGVAERTVRRWIAGGRLPARKRGRSFEIDISAARTIRDRAPGVEQSRLRDELVSLRTRCEVLGERLDRLERELAQERRRAGWLEAQLERAA
jgi:excisionase family DNA binding protein